MGIIGTVLAACGLGGERSDVPAVEAALQDAAELTDAHLGGEIRFQDSGQTGTEIFGVLALAGEDRADVEASLATVLEALVRTYRDQADVRTAAVRVEGHPVRDRALRVHTADVVPPSEGVRTTTDDLAAHFGL